MSLLDENIYCYRSLSLALAGRDSSRHYIPVCPYEMDDIYQELLILNMPTKYVPQEICENLVSQ